MLRYTRTIRHGTANQRQLQPEQDPADVTMLCRRVDSISFDG